jgi:hypothetical protein
MKYGLFLSPAAYRMYAQNGNACPRSQTKTVRRSAGILSFGSIGFETKCQITFGRIEAASTLSFLLIAFPFATH